jgi:hypothetical protein
VPARSLIFHQEITGDGVVGEVVWSIANGANLEFVKQGYFSRKHIQRIDDVKSNELWIEYFGDTDEEYYDDFRLAQGIIEMTRIDYLQ